MCLDVRKSAFGIFDNVRLKPAACSATETSYNIGILDGVWFMGMFHIVNVQAGLRFYCLHTTKSHFQTRHWRSSNYAVTHLCNKYSQTSIIRSARDRMNPFE